MLETAALIWGLANAARPQLRATEASFAVSYHAAPDCPTQPQFEAAILARAPGARSDGDPHSAQVRFEAELAPEPGQKRRLRVALDDGSSQDREIEADDCSEAVQSMAVIAAMILASRVAPPEPEPEAEAEPAPVPTSAQPARTFDTPNPARQNARPTWLAASAGAGIESSAAPSPTFAASASAELGSVTSSVLAPSLRLSVLFGQAADVTTSIGDARFRLALARVHACALRLGTLEADVRLCTVIEGGALLARGINARNQRSYAMPWLGAGLGAIGGLRVSARWTLELSGSVRGLLVRDEFIFAPGTPVYQPAIIAGDFRLGLAYRVW
jgi:hypothetical protein